MQLNSEQLHAFYQIAKTLSFSKAASALGLSQPALSIRIKKLEDHLNTSLFIRNLANINLTEAGHKLFLHCQLMGDFEKEFLNSINSKSSAPLAGLVRVAGYSTVVQSVLIPSLTGLIKKHPEIQTEIHTLELGQLTNSLKRSEAEFVVTTAPLESNSIESVLIGHEENVVVESPTISKDRINIYLDNDVDDNATFEFLKFQNKKIPKISRCFVDTAQNVLAAAEQGWGRAVHPVHIIKGNVKLRIVEEFNTFYNPVYLNYFRQPYYTKLHLLVRECLIKEFNFRLPKK